MQKKDVFSKFREMGLIVALLLLAGCGLLGGGEETDVGDDAQTAQSESADSQETENGTQNTDSQPSQSDAEVVESSDSRFGSAPAFSLKDVPTLADLIEKFPEIADFLDELDLSDPAIVRSIYEQMVTIYTEEGIEGLNVFLKDSGLAEQFGLDSSYIDYLMVYEDEGAEAAEELARTRGLINKNDQLRLVIIMEDGGTLADVQPYLDENSIEVLEDAGSEIEVGIPLTVLRAAQTSDVIMGQLIGITQDDMVSGIRAPRLAIGSQSGSEQVGQGVDLIGADSWHNAGLTGEGVKVAIVDLGFAGFLDLVGTELPSSEKIFIYNENDPQEMNAGNDPHGTATAEIVHDVAPDAELYLVNPETFLDYFDMVDWLVANEVQIVSHSVGIVTEPIDGTGILDELIDANRDNFVWINSSGNFAEAHLDMVYDDGDGLHVFPDGENLLPLAPLGTGTISLALQWEGAYLGGEDHDYDMYLLKENAAGDELEVVAASLNSQTGQKRDVPNELIEYFAFEDEVYYLAIEDAGTDSNKRLNLLGNNVFFKYSMPEGSLSSPADAEYAVAVGATNWVDDALEPYSSQGPTWDGRLKPEISAPARVDSAAYNAPFPGTSASAPHVAGVAALLLQANPSLSTDELREMIVQSAIDLGANGMDNEFGSGRVDLGSPPAEAVAALPDPTEQPTDSPTEVPTNTPLPEPTDRPTEASTSTPSPEPTDIPISTSTSEPTDVPTESPTSTPEPEATELPTVTATAQPTDVPTESATTAPEPTAVSEAEPTDEPSSGGVTGPLDAGYFTAEMETRSFPELGLVVSLPTAFETQVLEEDGIIYVVAEATDGNFVRILMQLSPLEDPTGEETFDSFKAFREDEGTITVDTPEEFEPLLAPGEQTSLKAEMTGTLDGVEIIGGVAVMEGLDEMIGVLHLYAEEEIWDPAAERLFELLLTTTVFFEPTE